jgi:hypothetical protein
VDLPQQRPEAVRLLVRLYFGAVLDHLVAYFGLYLAAQVGYRVFRHALYVSVEARFELGLRLSFLAVRNSALEIMLIFIFEHQTESVDQFFLACVQYSDFVSIGLVIVVDDTAAHPDLLLVVVNRGTRVPHDTVFGQLGLAVHPLESVFVRSTVLLDQLA